MLLAQVKCPEIVSTLEIIQAVGNIATVAGVIFSILFASKQLKLATSQMKENNVVSKSQIFNNLYQRLDSINILGFEHPEVFLSLAKEYKDNDDKNNALNSYIDLVKTFFYEMYYHHHNELLSKEEWISWDRTIVKFFAYPYVISYWNETKSEYSYDFNRYIDSIIKKSSTQNSVSK